MTFWDFANEHWLVTLMVVVLALIVVEGVLHTLIRVWAATRSITVVDRSKP